MLDDIIDQVSWAIGWKAGSFWFKHNIGGKIFAVLWLFISFAIWSAFFDENDSTLLAVAYMVVIIAFPVGLLILRYKGYNRRPGFLGVLVRNGAKINKYVFLIVTIGLWYVLFGGSTEMSGESVLYIIAGFILAFLMYGIPCYLYAIVEAYLKNIQN